MSAQQGEQGERRTRIEVRPGLTMIKRETVKEDGRRLNYYEFEHTPAQEAQEPR